MQDILPQGKSSFMNRKLRVPELFSSIIGNILSPPHCFNRASPGEPAAKMLIPSADHLPAKSPEQHPLFCRTFSMSGKCIFCACPIWSSDRNMTLLIDLLSAVPTITFEEWLTSNLPPTYFCITSLNTRTKDEKKEKTHSVAISATGRKKSI